MTYLNTNSISKVKEHNNKYSNAIGTIPGENFLINNDIQNF